MCYGYNGELALQRSLQGRGVDRRSMLRGAAGALATSALTVGAGVATAPSAAADPWRWRKVDPQKISIQMYTLRSALGGSPGFDEVCRQLKGIGYQHVELAGYYGRTAAELKGFLDGLGIAASSSHDGLSSSVSALSTKLNNATTLGQRYLVVPYLNSRKLEDWQRWADDMNAEANFAKGRGLAYGYHNHAHEFTIDLGGGRTPWDVLMERLDPSLVHLELDLYWSVRGGLESGHSNGERFSMDLIKESPLRVRQFHVKDRHASDGDMADLGTGHIRFERIFAAHEVEQYIVENDTPDVTPLKTARVGFTYLKKIRY